MPAGAINTIEEMFADPQVQARGLRIDLADAAGTVIPGVRTPVVLSETPLRYERPSPRLGEHQEEVLAELEELERTGQEKEIGIMKKTGGELIVEALKANGVTRLSCVPGESFLAVLDALYDSDIDVIVCRQEGGAAMMADCWGRLTGEPGICMVTRGPGADQRVGRPSYRPAGFDPDDPLHRPGAARCPRARGLPGGRIPPRLHRISPNGWARSTMPPASRNSSPAPLPSPPPAAPARWC